MSSLVHVFKRTDAKTRTKKGVTPGGRAYSAERTKTPPLAGGSSTHTRVTVRGKGEKTQISRNVRHEGMKGSSGYKTERTSGTMTGSTLGGKRVKVHMAQKEIPAGPKTPAKRKVKK